MVAYCCMVNCRSRGGKKKGKDKISFYRIPAIIGLNSRKYKTSYKTQTYRAPNAIDEYADKMIALSKERQTAWIKAIRRGELSESQLRTFRVCMKHFVSGKPAELIDRDNPDWVPCQNLGYPAGVAVKSQSALARHNRFLKRNLPNTESHITPYSEIFDSSIKDDPDVCQHCLRSFHVTDATIKVDHSLCLKKAKLEISGKIEEPTEFLKSENPSQLLKVTQSQISQKIVQNVSKIGKENGTSAHSATSTARLQSPAEDIFPFQSNVNLLAFDERKNKLNELLARAIYATSSPMDMTENYYWKKFFKAIRPNYIPPTALDLRRCLLKKEYKRVMASVQNKVSIASSYVLVTYGWSSPKGEVHFVVTTPEPVYFKCVISKAVKDEVYISEQIIKVIENIGADKLLFLLTDGAPTITKACGIVADVYPHITIVKSGAEDMKLLLKDIIKLSTVQEILKKAKEMILSINLSETDIGRNEEEVKSFVRWGAISTLKTLLENKSAFQADIVVDEMLPEEVRQKILDEDKEFWTEAERLLELLYYISEGIKTLEADKALLSDLPTAFAAVQKKLLTFRKECTLLLDEEKDSICSYISNRKESAVKSIHRAANMLDPRYRGLGFSNADIMNAIKFLRQRCDHLGINEISVCTNLEDYRTSCGAYSRSFLWGSAKHITPVEWWRNFCRNQPLFSFAIELLSVSPSSAVYQRMFKDIEINPRHGLDLEDLEKLVTIKSNLLVSKDTRPEVLDSILSS